MLVSPVLEKQLWRGDTKRGLEPWVRDAVVAPCCREASGGSWQRTCPSARGPQRPPVPPARRGDLARGRAGLSRVGGAHSP